MHYVSMNHVVVCVYNVSGIRMQRSWLCWPTGKVDLGSLTLSQQLDRVPNHLCSPGLKSFRLEVPFNVTEKAFDTSTGKLLFNIGLDVFQKRGGSANPKP